MRKFILLICGTVLLATLAACTGNSNGGVTQSPSPSGGTLTPSEYGDADFDTSGDIVIETEYEVYGSDAPEVSYIISNRTETEFVYGVQYAVEVLRDGVWYQVPFPENTAWIDIGIILKPNGLNTDSFKFSALDFKMTDGHYRLIKEIGSKRYFDEFQVGRSPITEKTPFGYQALEKLPKEYTGEAASENGDVVFTHTEIKNADKLSVFLDKVELGFPAMVRIVQYTVEGDPIITDYIYNKNHRGYYVYRHDNSRDKYGSGVGITETIYSYLITDGTALYLSNCASWELTQTYTTAETLQINWDTSLGDISFLVTLVEKMTAERLDWNTTLYKVYSPDGKQNVALFSEDLSYGYDGLTSSEIRQVSDPDGIATKITDVFWLDDNSFVLVCDTTDSLKYYDIVSDGENKSGYGTSYQVTDGRVDIIQ